jgi:hypothetical protein
MGAESDGDVRFSDAAAQSAVRVMGQPRVGQFDLLALGRAVGGFYDSGWSLVNGLAGVIRAAVFA